MTCGVTPYRYDERYAAGDYPTLSTAGQGLPAWTKANRSIDQTDIVLWYTVDMHHTVRAEDWPVMPVLWHSFDLRPFDFLIEIRRWICLVSEEVGGPGKCFFVIAGGGYDELRQAAVEKLHSIGAAAKSRT